MKRIAFSAILLSMALCAFGQGYSAEDIRQALGEKAGGAANFGDSGSGLTSAGLISPQTAMANPEYLVTAGDMYVIAYLAGTQAVSYPVIIDSTYKLRVSNLGVIDVYGKTFTEVKKQVESIVAKNYPLSGVQFALKTPSIFGVTLKGEVKATAEERVNALSRLSSVIASNLTPYASIRDISITGMDGITRKYDLFKAQRLGILSQDPYLRPGDVINVSRVSRTVRIEGEVERPDSYQLLEGEGLRDLVEKYGNGFTPLADASRIEMTRIVNSASVSGDKIYLNAESVASNFELQNYDIVVVSKNQDLMPVMFLEGAVKKPEEAAAQLDKASAKSAVPEGTNRITVQFSKGENYSSLVHAYRNYFSAVSDTANAYIVREGEHIPINLNPMLYDASYRSDYFVKENDVLIIPFMQYFVTVSGAVAVPGRYPYIPDRDWSYYVALAGGFIPNRNSNEIVTIKDVFGKKHDKDVPVTPETIIHAESNAFLFYFNQYAPIISTTLAAVGTLLTAISLAQ